MTRLELMPDVVETLTDDDLRSRRAPRIGGPQRELPRRVKAVRLQLRTIQVMSGLKGLFGRGARGVYVISSVVDDIGERPITFQCKTYGQLQEGQLLPLGPSTDPTAVLNVYLREGQLPRVLSFCLLVVASNEALRQLGTTIAEVVADEQYSKLARVVQTAVTAANPAYGVVWQVAQQSIALIGARLKLTPDAQLGYYQANFTNRFDDLGVGIHPPGGRTMEVERIRLAYQIDAR